jgi:hypothetical protein
MVAPITEYCCCGQPLHYTNPRTEERVRELISEHGYNVTIHSCYGTWEVPRHYIALHGLKTSELPILAIKYNWKKHESAPA